MIRYVSTEAQFIIKYDGKDEHYHELDAALLSQALFGLSEMGRLAYRAANPGETHQIQVKVQALQAGSFEIVLEQVVPFISQVVGEVIDLFNREDVQRTINAVDSLFIISQAINFIRLTAGKKYKVEPKGDEFHITINGDVNVYQAPVYNLATNREFRQAVHQSMAPLDDPHYDSLQISDTAGRAVERLEEHERGLFSAYEEVVILDETVEVRAYVETPQFRENSRLWVFIDEYDQKFSARMDDEKFALLAGRVNSPIGRETILRLKRHTRITRVKNGKTRTVRRIVEVLGFTNPGHQEQLF